MHDYGTPTSPPPHCSPLQSIPAGTRTLPLFYRSPFTASAPSSAPWGPPNTAASVSYWEQSLPKHTPQHPGSRPPTSGLSSPGRVPTGVSPAASISGEAHGWRLAAALQPLLLRPPCSYAQRKPQTLSHMAILTSGNMQRPPSRRRRHASPASHHPILHQWPHSDGDIMAQTG